MTEHACQLHAGSHAARLVDAAAVTHIHEGRVPLPAKLQMLLGDVTKDLLSAQV
jgi:hypothetical protein